NPTQQAAPDWFVQAAQTGEIKLSMYPMGDMKDSSNHTLNVLNSIGFEPTPEARERAWEAFARRADNALTIGSANHPFIPKAWAEKPVEAFLEETGILGAMQEKLEEILSRLPAPSKKSLGG
ncbi:MAG: hypothetical protein J0L97_05905, partial [Alphaproteobacteria bacterium]|nr:hypothetical protein [Alphaproteobacteria bacterium]